MPTKSIFPLTQRLRAWADRAFLYLFVFLFLFVTLLPFYWILISSVTPKYQMFSIPPRYWPSEFTLENYVNMARNIPFFRYFRNSLLFAFGSSVVLVAFSFLVSYVLARIRFRGSNIVFMGFILSIALPQIGFPLRGVELDELDLALNIQRDVQPDAGYEGFTALVGVAWDEAAGDRKSVV